MSHVSTEKMGKGRDFQVMSGKSASHSRIMSLLAHFPLYREEKDSFGILLSDNLYYVDVTG